MRIYYFGCYEQAGHYMYTPDMRTDSQFMKINPWGCGIDDGFKGLQHKDGWTALARADYTVDTRPGSNSVFLAQGTLTEPQMVELAHQYFPSVAKRIGLRVSAPDKAERKP